MEKLIPAPLDEKNVTTDWIEELFDDQNAIHGRHKMLGFMNSAVMLVTWHDNVLTWKVIDGDANAAIKCLTERYKESYPEEDSPFILKTQMYSAVCVMRFYWNPEND